MRVVIPAIEFIVDELPPNLTDAMLARHKSDALRIAGAAIDAAHTQLRIEQSKQEALLKLGIEVV